MACQLKTSGAAAAALVRWIDKTHGVCTHPVGNVADHKLPQRHAIEVAHPLLRSVKGDSPRSSLKGADFGILQVGLVVGEASKGITRSLLLDLYMRDSAGLSEIVLCCCGEIEMFEEEVETN